MAIIKSTLTKTAKILDSGIYIVQLGFAWVIFRILGLNDIHENGEAELKGACSEVTVDAVRSRELASQ